MQRLTTWTAWAAGVAVLEAIQEDGLQQHAHQVGTYLIQQLESLQKVTLSVGLGHHCPYSLPIGF